MPTYQPRGLGLNGKSVYMNVTKPSEIFLSFAVASANGLGVTSVKSNGYVRNVFMHTSGAPTSNNGALNPNPANGYALIQLYNNFNAYLGCQASIAAGPTGGSSASVTAGNPYIISVLGSSAAQWQAFGLPAGLTPALNQSFIATATGSIAGGGQVKVPAVSSGLSVNIVGDPNLELANANIIANAGAYILVQFAAATSSSVTTPIATAPADGSVVSMRLSFDGSSVTVDGL